MNENNFKFEFESQHEETLKQIKRNYLKWEILQFIGNFYLRIQLSIIKIRN